MSREQLQFELEKWKRLSLVYAGAAGTLLVIALVGLPSSLAALAYNSYDRSFILDGWYGVWLVLLLASLIPGISLLPSPSCKVLPLAMRLNTAFGFLAEAWIALLAFEIRMILLDVPALFHFTVIGFGLILFIAYLLLKRKLGVGEEIFP